MNFAKIFLQGLSYTAANWVGVLLTFVATAYVTRLLGPEARGVYAWAGGILTLAVQAGLLGFDTVFRFRATRQAKVGRLFWHGVLIALGLGAVIVLGTLLAVPFLGYPRPVAVALVVAMLGAPLALANMMAGAVFQGSRNVPALVGTTLGQKGALAVLLVGLALTPWLGVNTVLLATGAAYGVSLLQAFGYAARQMGPFWKENCHLSEHLADWKLGVSSYTADATMALLARLPLLVAFAVLGAKLTGWLSIAIMLVEVMLVIPGVLAVIVAPHSVISALPPASMKRELLKLLGLIMLMLAAVAAVAWVCAPVAIVLVYGPAFTEAVAMFRLLLGYFLAMGAFRLMYPLLVNHCRPRWLMVPPFAGMAALGLCFGALGYSTVGHIVLGVTVAAVAMAAVAWAIFMVQGVKIIPQDVESLSVPHAAE